MMYFYFLQWMAALFAVLAVLTGIPNMALNYFGRCESFSFQSPQNLEECRGSAKQQSATATCVLQYSNVAHSSAGSGATMLPCIPHSHIYNGSRKISQ